MHITGACFILILVGAPFTFQYEVLHSLIFTFFEQLPPKSLIDDYLKQFFFFNLNFPISNYSTETMHMGRSLSLYGENESAWLVQSHVTSSYSMSKYLVNDSIG